MDVKKNEKNGFYAITVAFDIEFIRKRTEKKNKTKGAKGILIDLIKEEGSKKYIQGEEAILNVKKRFKEIMPKVKDDEQILLWIEEAMKSIEKEMLSDKSEKNK